MSGRGLAACEFRKIRIEPRSHASHIAAQIVVTLGGRAGSRLEMGAQHPAGKSEHGGVRAGRRASHEKRLVAEEVGDRIDRSRRQREDLIRRVTSYAVAVE